MPLDYEKLFREAYRSNVEKVAEEASEGKLDDKIDNFCSLHDVSRDHLMRQIQSNRIVAACFAINPNKQNFFEKTAAKHIGNISGVEKFETLPNNALVVMQGAVLDRRSLRAQGGTALAKTIDFKWEYRAATFYASHKYTKQEGGSQGSQYKDLQIFIEQARDTTLRDTFFMAIADGAFYSGQNGQAGASRMERLKALASGGKVFACGIDEIEALMKGLRIQGFRR